MKSKSLLVSCLGLTLVLLAAYANHFQNDFHFDDFHTVTGNPFIRDLANVPRFFRDPSLFSTLPDHQTWRPVVSVSLAIDYWLGHSLKPFYFHLSTFCWFVLQAILMFFLFRRIMDRADPHPSNLWTALLAAAFYGLHPANAETVNYVIQRGDLYCTLGIVASLLCFARFPGQRRYCWYLLPALLAIMAKPPALIFPTILLGYVFLVEEKDWAGSLRATIPALLVTVGCAILQSRMTPATFIAGAANPLLYRVTQPWVMLYYAKSFFLPTELSADTDWSYVPGVLSTQAVTGYLFAALLLFVLVRTSRTRETRPIAFGILWFILALLPTSMMPLAEVMNDHRMFFAFVGLALAVFWWLRLALFRKTARLTLHRSWTTGAIVLATLALSAAAAGTHQRNVVWRNEESLWRDVTVKSPQNGRGLMNYGLIFMARGDFGSALSYFERALAFTPNYWALETNLAIANGGIRRDAEAERHFLRALAVAPHNADPRFYYGRWLQAQGRTGEAVAQLEAAVRLNRLSFDARHLLLQLYAQQDNAPALDRLAQETLQLAPGDDAARRALADRANPQPLVQPPTGAEALLDLSHKFYQAGQYRECIAAARKALELKPDYAEAYNNIAAAYSSLGQWDEGIQAGLQAVRLKPDDQLARNNLAWAKAHKARPE